MSDAESTHDEHLDSWGKMRRDAVQDYGCAASQAMCAGGRWNKVNFADVAMRRTSREIQGDLVERLQRTSKHVEVSSLKIGTVSRLSCGNV